jgi:hypothetical protein
VPLVLVVGDEPTSGPRPWDVDQIALASAVGARTYTVGRADAAATTVIAIEHALAYRVPTVLAIPYDVAKLEAGGAGRAAADTSRADRPSPFAVRRSPTWPRTGRRGASGADRGSRRVALGRRGRARARGRRDGRRHRDDGAGSRDLPRPSSTSG